VRTGDVVLCVPATCSGMGQRAQGRPPMLEQAGHRCRTPRIGSPGLDVWPVGVNNAAVEVIPFDDNDS